MFLSAVLQAHTDSVSKTHPAAVEQDADVALPEQLEKALTLPLPERLQPLPSAHRSRWV
jgi:hypothetical protein